MELTNEEREEIADLIQQGYTSGILDSEDEKGRATRISWSFNADKFINE